MNAECERKADTLMSIHLRKSSIKGKNQQELNINTTNIRFPHMFPSSRLIRLQSILSGNFLIADIAELEPFMKSGSGIVCF